MINYVLKYIFFLLVIFQTIKAATEISDKRLCANADCSEPISYAESLIRYNSPHHKILSFAPNQDVTIYSKSAGKNKDLWGAEIMGKRGYVPKMYVRETKILMKNPHFEVDTELLQQNDTAEQSEVHKSTPQPNPVKAAYEIVDGTTIYMDDAIIPTSPDNSVKPTVTPDVNRQTKPLDVPDVNQQTQPLETPEKIEKSSIENLEILEQKEDTNTVVDDSIVGNIISGLSDFLTNTVEKQDDNEDDDDDDEEGEDDGDDEVEVEDGDEEQIPKNTIAPPKPDDSPQQANSFDSTQKTNSDSVPQTLTPNLTQETTSDSTQEFTSDSIQQQNSDTILEVSPDSIPPPNNDSEMNDQKILIKDSNTEIKTDVVEETKESSNYSNNFDNQPAVPDDSVYNEKPVVEPLNISEPVIESNVVKETSSVETDQNTTTEPVENTLENETPNKIEVNDVAIDDLNNNYQEAALNTNKIDESNRHSIDNTNPTENLDSKDASSEANILSENTLTTESAVYNDAPEDYFVENVTSDPGQAPVNANDNEDNHKEINRDSLDVSNTITNNNEENLDSNSEIQHDHVQQAEKVENLDQMSAESTEKPDIANDEADETSTNEENINKLNSETTDESTKIDTFGDDITNTNNNEENTEPSVDTGENNDLENDNDSKNEEVEEKPESPGIFTSIYDKIFGTPKTNKAEEMVDVQKELGDENIQAEFNPAAHEDAEDKLMEDLINSKHQNVLVVTAITILLFLLGYMLIDQNRKEAPLIAKINKLEKELLVKIKECTDLTEKYNGSEGFTEAEVASSELVVSLKAELENSKSIQTALEEQVQALEKELENSTEVGLELNRMLSEILNSQNASETLITNIEHLQKQLLEQQGVINSLNESLTVKNTENHELNLELDISNKKVTDLQTELDKMVLNLLKIEEEKEQQQNSLETEVVTLKEQIAKCDIESKLQITNLNDELNLLRSKLSEVEKQFEIKTNEFNLLKESAKEWNAVGNKSETLKSLLEVNSLKAELQQLKHDNKILNEHLHREQEMKNAYEKQIEITMKEIQKMKVSYDEADKQKLEAQTKLEVLSTYFKGREAELQKELSKQENMWIEKQGEANSTIERIKYMQEELQNCKAQNEALKQEIVSQEVELKSHISVLEKKAHENWLVARQAERRLEDAKQEAAQLRNRLTLRERTLNDDKLQNRVQSPLEHNGDLSASPLHMNVENPASPPLLFGTQNHLTTSPPLPGLPPFLPPPPGVPFMPPPLHGVPPFMPPHLPFPSDHRPAPLGRLSSPPPLNSRYSPDSRAYSPYDRNSPSPPYDSEYSPSSPNSLPRMYSPYNSRIDDRKEYMRPPPIRKSRNTKVSGTLSSGSGNSNESLEKINRHTSSKV